MTVITGSNIQLLKFAWIFSAIKTPSVNLCAWFCSIRPVNGCSSSSSSSSSSRFCCILKCRKFKFWLQFFLLYLLYHKNVSPRKSCGAITERRVSEGKTERRTIFFVSARWWEQDSFLFASTSFCKPIAQEWTSFNCWKVAVTQSWTKKIWGQWVILTIVWVSFTAVLWCNWLGDRKGYWPVNPVPLIL